MATTNNATKKCLKYLNFQINVKYRLKCNSWLKELATYMKATPSFIVMSHV